MKITQQLVEVCVERLNAARDLELDMRDYRIPAIENLGTTNDHYTCIDLSHNSIEVLGNFPKLKKLETLYLACNRISTIESGLGETLVNLDTLILSKNLLHNLFDLTPLWELKSLTKLSLIDNPVANQTNYRLYVIHNLPNLKVLDFKRIKLQERVAAKAIYAPQKTKGSKNKASASASVSEKKKSNVAAIEKGSKKQEQEAKEADQEEKEEENDEIEASIQQAIMNASSFEELESLNLKLQQHRKLR